MKSDQLFKFKILFETERRKLLYSDHVVNESFHYAKDDLIDEMDLTSTELETSMRMRLRNREALYLRKIEEALLRILAGTFGVCAGCENDIELRRLEARPTATLCVHCKEEAERIEQIHIDGHQSKSLGSKIRAV